MKTLLTLVMLAVAGSIQAASINWGTTSKTAFGGSTVGGISATLVYLGTSGVAESYSFTTDDTLADIISSIGTKVDEATSNPSGMQKGRLGGTWPIGENNTPDLADGDNLVILLTYKSGDDTYYNLSNVGSASYDNAAGIWNDFSVGAVWTTSGTDGVLAAGGGWAKGAANQDPITPDVPEPATGALALAGVALLFKRRRA